MFGFGRFRAAPLLWLGHIFFALLASTEGTVRHYYLAAVELEWDYAPFRRNMVGPDTEFVHLFIVFNVVEFQLN